MLLLKLWGKEVVMIVARVVGLVVRWCGSQGGG